MSNTITGNKSVMLEATRIKGKYLSHTRHHLNDDKALKYASTMYQDDRGIVLTAIQNDHDVVRFMSQRLKDDSDMRSSIEQ